MPFNFLSSFLHLWVHWLYPSQRGTLIIITVLHFSHIAQWTYITKIKLELKRAHLMALLPSINTFCRMIASRSINHSSLLYSLQVQILIIPFSFLIRVLSFFNILKFIIISSLAIRQHSVWCNIISTQLISSNFKFYEPKILLDL